METDATPTHHRDALIVAVLLLLLGGLWLVLRLYWQGALLALVGAGLLALTWRRGEAGPPAPEDVPTLTSEPTPRRLGSGKGKGRKKRR